MDNIVGIKDSSGNFENIQQYIEQTKMTTFRFAGTDSLILKRFKREEREQSQQQQICFRIS
ncbi:hypothetical protein PO124_11615 [Bacillus licheniformis]|nr:hypothetical protein [Bacillus licheniformis]